MPVTAQRRVFGRPVEDFLDECGYLVGDRLADHYSRLACLRRAFATWKGRLGASSKSRPLRRGVTGYQCGREGPGDSRARDDDSGHDDDDRRGGIRPSDLAERWYVRRLQQRCFSAWSVRVALLRKQADTFICKRNERSCYNVLRVLHLTCLLREHSEKRNKEVLVDALSAWRRAFAFRAVGRARDRCALRHALLTWHAEARKGSEAVVLRAAVSQANARRLMYAWLSVARQRSRLRHLHSVASEHLRLTLICRALSALATNVAQKKRRREMAALARGFRLRNIFCAFVISRASRVLPRLIEAQETSSQISFHRSGQHLPDEDHESPLLLVDEWEEAPAAWEASLKECPSSSCGQREGDPPNASVERTESLPHVSVDVNESTDREENPPEASRGSAPSSDGVGGASLSSVEMATRPLSHERVRNTRQPLPRPVCFWISASDQTSDNPAPVSAMLVSSGDPCAAPISSVAVTRLATLPSQAGGACADVVRAQAWESQLRPCACSNLNCKGCAKNMLTSAPQKLVSGAPRPPDNVRQRTTDRSVAEVAKRPVKTPVRAHVARGDDAATQGSYLARMLALKELAAKATTTSKPFALTTLRRGDIRPPPSAFLPSANNGANFPGPSAWTPKSTPNHITARAWPRRLSLRSAATPSVPSPTPATSAAVVANAKSQTAQTAPVNTQPAAVALVKSALKSSARLDPHVKQRQRKSVSFGVELCV
eukprot:Opistho-2@41385